MPNFNILKESKINKTFRTDIIKSKFDLKVDEIKENFQGSIDIENKDWSIGIIYGNSGTGKSTIGQKIFEKHYFKGFKYFKKSIIDDMPEHLSVDDISKIFNSVGFSSPPSWLKPYDVLSNGEKMRVDLARAILENKEIIVFDEFTSVVDRNIAKIGSFAVQKAIRRQNKKFVAISCHDDIVEWLQPDWIFNTNTMSFFLVNKLKDQKLIYQSINAKNTIGKCLGNITI